MNENNPIQENPISNGRQWVNLYSNLFARAIISFAISLLLIFILRSWLHTSVLVTLIFAFFLSILIAPFFSKINIGEKILQKYLNALDGMFVRKKQ